uniref:Uncharacterized protein n=1 Tax=Chrysotila carterae TaxID=13221 RepID=A0A7S4ETL2_CHRCT
MLHSRTSIEWRQNSALRSSLSLIEAGSVEVPSSLTWRSMGAGNELLQQLDEYLRWPRDIDSSRRSGFPGKDQWAAPESVGLHRPTDKVRSESVDRKFIE